MAVPPLDPREATGNTGRPTTHFISPPLASNELNGMADQVMGSIRDLLTMDLEPASDSSCYRRGPRYPREHLKVKHGCIDPRKKHVTDTPNENSPPIHVDARREGELGFPNP